MENKLIIALLYISVLLVNCQPASKLIKRKAAKINFRPLRNRSKRCVEIARDELSLLARTDSEDESLDNIPLTTAEEDTQRELSILRRLILCCMGTGDNSHETGSTYYVGNRSSPDDQYRQVPRVSTSVSTEDQISSTHLREDGNHI